MGPWQAGLGESGAQKPHTEAVPARWRPCPDTMCVDKAETILEARSPRQKWTEHAEVLLCSPHLLYFIYPFHK
jgi:hypothetical protein